MARRRYYTDSTHKAEPGAAYPDYVELFKTSTIAPPPPVNYVPFDSDVFSTDGDESRPQLDTLRALLTSSAIRDPRVQWCTYEQTYDLPKQTLPLPGGPTKPDINFKLEPTLPSPPSLKDFLPKRTALEERFPFLYAVRCAITERNAQKKLEDALKTHNVAYAPAERALAEAREHNKKMKSQLEAYESARNAWETLWKQFAPENLKNEAEWKARKARFNALQADDRKHLEELKAAYYSREPGAIAKHCLLVLSRSPYPRLFPRNADASYDSESQIVVIDHPLPDIETIPIVKERTGRSRFSELVPINTTERRQISDDVLYMIMLRVMREVVLADEINAFRAVAVNGWMSFKDKATGQQRSEYLMSVYAKSDQIRAIDFVNVDPKTCFKGLKGISSPRPSQCVPIAPVIMFDKNDRRIVPGRDVIDVLASETNLAGMPWVDFEHLIRELFEKEFGHGGAEVRVTQASHDRGVDALVFDPDPIRGGKFVIQAKRYTLTVDVSAVRDLYGTVVNEGANRGILVTTSAFGADAYEFAKDKPLTLIDGSRLLHMLQRHGYNFRIDLKEARRLLSEQEGLVDNRK